MAREDYLFTGPDWHSVDRHQRQQMAAEIERVDADSLLNTSVEDLANFFAEKFKIVVPVLDVDDLVVDQREKQIDVSRDPMRMIMDHGCPVYITGTIESRIQFGRSLCVRRLHPGWFQRR